MNYILFLCLIGSIHQHIKASSSLRRSAAAITPALRRTNPSLQQTAQYSTRNINPDGSEEFNVFNDEHKQLDSKIIKYPDNTESFIWYRPNRTIRSESFEDKNGDTSCVFYDKNGNISSESKNTKHPQTHTCWNHQGDIEYKRTTSGNTETTDYYNGSLLESKRIEYADGTTEYIIYNSDGTKKYMIYNSDGTKASETFEDKNSESKPALNDAGFASLKKKNKYPLFNFFEYPYVYDKSGNNVGYKGTYDMNGLDKYGRTTDGKLEDLD